ncbi:AAA family ATPase [Saccharibacillus sp. CPCC 101409]|uniref:AAA family ATPase n=1 Tax=Saccharibacillus sp. CPCC 101409 TaxID=3058041 RepID=UPI0026718CB2|nr:AAA family ATPase [Saccharibacillus sp. CPCC 101409]MDO3411256.1 AAA family ATPase [Saccharibacillus sp. CPCC 101409]
MIKSLYVDNFKSLQDFEIEFTSRLTVFIGTNSVGKSTVLQAVDLLSYFGIGKLEDYLYKHNWKAAELKSKLYHASKRNMNFSVRFALEDQNLQWDFTLVAKKNELTCIREKITVGHERTILLARDSKSLGWFDFSKSKFDTFPEMQLNGSMLSLIDPSQEDYTYRFPQLSMLKEYISSIKSFELLSPDFMRKTSRYDSNDLGIGGERLGSFLHNLSQENKDKINSKLKDYYPYLEKVFTQKKQYGHVHLGLSEKFFGSDPYPVNSNYVSDGLLRIMAIVSLGALGENHRVLLLDEIEDGINPNLAAELVNYLSEIGQSMQKQIFVTTHSPVILNYFNRDNIVYLWRTSKGRVHAQKMFESPELARQLDYMNPGEIWLNFEQAEIEEALMKTLVHSGEKDAN